MRKFFLFLLLITVWAALFLPGAPILSSAFSLQAHPSNQPPPPAWQDTQRVTIQPRVETPAADMASLAVSPLTGGRCSNAYRIQAGDSLGKIAKTCGVSLSDLLAANTQILNPDRIYPGEQITIPGIQSPAGGSGSPAAGAGAVQANGFQPGAEMEIHAAGLPPNTPMRIGLGLSASGYMVLGERQTDAEGRLVVDLTLPADVPPGETAFIMLTSLGSPAVQRTSESFIIGRKN